MKTRILNEAAALLEKANANLEPELLSADTARELLAEYARVKKLGGCIGGRPRGRRCPGGRRHLARPGSRDRKGRAGPSRLADELLAVARDEAFHVLRERARKVRLEAEQNRGLGDRQNEARSARSYSDDLGMVNVHLRLEPHVGTPIVNRAEAEADRLYRKAKKQGETEPFERVLADAYVTMLTGKGKGRTTRPELVVLVTHEVAKRGWTNVRDGEVCKIPGVGPVSPEVAREGGM